MINFEPVCRPYSACKYFYAMKYGKVLAEIAKFDDTNTETHPFKVSIKKGQDFKPEICFWPRIEDVPDPIEAAKGYFKHQHGGLEEAKQYILDLFEERSLEQVLTKNK